MNNTIFGVDLAKELIQVCVYTNKKVHSNQEMTLTQFALWLLNAKPVTIVFEACGMSNYWKQRATASGHNAQLFKIGFCCQTKSKNRSKRFIGYCVGCAFA